MELSFTNNDEFVEDQIQAFSMRTKWEPRRWCFVDANYSRVAGMVAIEGDLLSLQGKMGGKGGQTGVRYFMEIIGAHVQSAHRSKNLTFTMRKGDVIEPVHFFFSTFFHI